MEEQNFDIEKAENNTKNKISIGLNNETPLINHDSEISVAWNSKIMISLIKKMMNNAFKCITKNNIYTFTLFLALTISSLVLFITALVMIGYYYYEYIGIISPNKNCYEIKILKILKNNDIYYYQQASESQFNSCYQDSNSKACAINENIGSLEAGLNLMVITFMIILFESIVPIFITTIYTMEKNYEGIILFKIVFTKALILKITKYCFVFSYYKFFGIIQPNTKIVVINNIVPTYYKNNTFNCVKLTNDSECCESKINSADYFVDMILLGFLFELLLVFFVIICKIIMLSFEQCKRKYNEEYTNLMK